MSLFEARRNLKPYEYPEFIEYKDAIRHSYWVHDEFNFEGDVQNYKVDCKPHEQEAMKRAMLAIAQIEVSVKTFWADLYHRMPKPEIAGVGMTFAECHEEGTEILTEEGWMDFRDLKEDTRVAQVDPKTTELTFVVPDRIVEKPYEGEMYHVDNRTYEFSVTPNHRFLYETRAGNMMEKKVKDMSMFHSDMNLPFTTHLSNEEGKSTLSPEDKLRIALQADGSKRYYRRKDDERVKRGLSSGCHTYDISLKKDRKQSRLKGLLQNLNLEHREYDTDREGYIRFEIDVPLEWGDLKTFDWIDLSEVSSAWCEEFIDELGLWDGCVVEGTHNYKDKFMEYSTTEKSCADKTQAVGTLAGYRSVLSTRQDDRKESFQDIYKVGFSERNTHVSMTENPDTKQYKGSVYCVSVPTGCIVTRYNDKVLISGNSEVRHADAYSHLLELLGLNEEFERVTEIPALADRIEYLDDYMVDGEDVNSNQDFALSILLFSIFIEHVSLFSQFLIMLAFDRYTKRFKGVANAVEATSKEEQIHGLFGAELINTLRDENPDWFDRAFEKRVVSFCQKAHVAEMKVLDWILEEGELDFLPRPVIDAFVRNRFNRSLQRVGYDPIFDVKSELLDETQWFYEEILLTKDGDFFQKRQTTYSKSTQSVTEDDLFDD